ncbi:MAG: manganese efflux pump [Clostridiales bacterium]|nr:manganese efflux pump [Clostridiales bacterium]
MLTLICLSFSLAADAFVASVCDGMAYRPKPMKRILIASTFGIAQGLMPVIGALIGDRMIGILEFKRYVSFAALLIVGVIMLLEGFEKPDRPHGMLGVKTVLFQAFATSIDALACGLTLAVMPFPLWVDGLTIGLITACVCLVGITLATFIGKRFNRPERFKVLGGLILIALALKDLVYCFSA